MVRPLYTNKVKKLTFITLIDALGLVRHTAKILIYLSISITNANY